MTRRGSKRGGGGGGGEPRHFRSASARGRYAALTRWHGKEVAARYVYRDTSPPAREKPQPRTAPPQVTDFFGIKEAAAKVADGGKLTLNLPFYKASGKAENYDQHAAKKAGDDYFADADGDDSHYWRLNAQFQVTFSDAINADGEHSFAIVTMIDADESDDDDDAEHGDAWEGE